MEIGLGIIVVLLVLSLIFSGQESLKRADRVIDQMWADAGQDRRATEARWAREAQERGDL